MAKNRIFEGKEETDGKHEIQNKKTDFHSVFYT